MNILIIGTTDIVGGAAKVSWALKEALEKGGHKVSMFVADKKSNDPNVHVIKRSKWRKLLGFLLATENLIETDWIMDTDDFKQADIVHCHNLHGRFFNLNTLQKMSLIKPIVWTLHDAWAITPHCAHTFESTEMKYGLYSCPSINTPPRTLWNNDARLSRDRIKIYEQSRLHIVVPSQWLRSRVEKTVLSKQDIKYIPNGIDTRMFRKMDKSHARKLLDLPEDKKIFLFLADDARNNIWKGWHYVEMLAKECMYDKNILFVCVGNRNHYQDEENIRYRNQVSDISDLLSYYGASDAFLMTSISENFPLVTLEAMSCGLPFISFNVGGVQEVVTHKENGYIARYKNIADLKDGLNWFMGLSEIKINEMSEICRNKAKKHYDTSLMVKKYMELYNNLINEK